MASSSDTASGQTDFLSHSRELYATHPEFTEICNALYEREVIHLANNGPAQINILKRRLRGLPYHIQRAAYFLTNHNSPLAVDSHNGTWQSKQAGRCPGNAPDEVKTAAWFAQHAKAGLIINIRVQMLDNEHIELDSVDRVEMESQTLHANKHGWFRFSGQSLQEPPAPHTQLLLLKPTKAVMTAACCGHSWNHRGKVSPRTLTLRELLLSAHIDWKHFRLLPARK